MDFTVNLPSEGSTVHRGVIHVSMVAAILGIFLFFCSGLLADLWKLDHLILNPFIKNGHHFFGCKRQRRWLLVGLFCWILSFGTARCGRGGYSESL